MQARRIGIVGFDGMMALDAVGPADVFHAANPRNRAGPPRYEVVIIGERAGRFATEAGLYLHAAVDFATAPELDTLIIPGGEGLRTRTSAGLVDFIRRRASSTRRVASVCTGIYALAATGLLDGRRATTHWGHVAPVRALFPAVNLQADAIFLRDGRFFSSAGVTAGIDLALAMVEDDYGPALALEVARELVVFFKRPGDQHQYSAQLRTQARSGDRFADLAAWMPDHLADDLSIEALAARVHLSPRQFGRRFRAQFGEAPSAHVVRLRMETAARLLAGSRQTVDSVAAAVGYRGEDVFRRAFFRYHGVTPGLNRAEPADPGPLTPS